MDSTFSLAGHNAIITGGTRGIGLAIAGGFLQAGATVTLCSRKQENVDQAIAELESHADKLLGVTAHVGRGEELEPLVAAATEKFGPVNVLVNNAGTNPYYGPIIDSEEWAWDKTMAVNLKAPRWKAWEVRAIASGGSGAGRVSWPCMLTMVTPCSVSSELASASGRNITIRKWSVLSSSYSAVVVSPPAGWTKEPGCTWRAVMEPSKGASIRL